MTATAGTVRSGIQRNLSSTSKWSATLTGSARIPGCSYASLFPAAAPPRSVQCDLIVFRSSATQRCRITVGMAAAVARLPRYEAGQQRAKLSSECGQWRAGLSSTMGCEAISETDPEAAVHAEAQQMILAPRGLEQGARDWKQKATHKVTQARAGAPITTKRKKCRQPSPPVPQLWSEDDLEEQFVRGSGPGGQKINKTSCCVLITVRVSLAYKRTRDFCGLAKLTCLLQSLLTCTHSICQLAFRCAASAPARSKRTGALGAKCCRRG